MLRLRLREVRERKFLSQGELAKESGMTVTNISRIESGQTARPSTVRKLAAALGVDPEELVIREEKGEDTEPEAKPRRTRRKAEDEGADSGA